MISTAVQAGVVAAVILALERAGRRWSPAARESLVAVALAKFLVPATLPGWGLFTFAAAFFTSPLVNPAVGDAAAAERWQIWLAAAVFVHVAGVSLMAARLVSNWWVGRGLLQVSAQVNGGPLDVQACRVAARLGMRRAPSVWISNRADGPIAFGLVTPHVVIPARLAAESRLLEVVLAHEFAHHRRGDLWKLAVHRLVVTLWWWHPLAWALASPLREAIEDACDDLVLGCGIASVDEYGEALVGCAHLAIPAPGALCFGDRHHPLSRRLMRLGVPRAVASWRTPIGAALAALLLLPGIPTGRAHTRADDVRIVIRRVERPASTPSRIVTER